MATSMQNRKGGLQPSADAIAEMATRGGDVSSYFTNKFTVARPIRRVNVDLAEGTLRELDEWALSEERHRERARRRDRHPAPGVGHIAKIML